MSETKRIEMSSGSVKIENEWQVIFWGDSFRDAMFDRGWKIADEPSYIRLKEFPEKENRRGAIRTDPAAVLLTQSLIDLKLIPNVESRYHHPHEFRIQKLADGAYFLLWTRQRQVRSAWANGEEPSGAVAFDQGLRAAGTGIDSAGNVC